MIIRLRMLLAAFLLWLFAMALPSRDLRTLGALDRLLDALQAEVEGARS